MDIRLVVTDLDGTLLGPDKTISDHAVENGLTVLYSQEGREAAMSETDWVRQRNYPVHNPEDSEWSHLTADKVNLISGEKREEFRRLSTSFQGLSDLYKFVCYGDTGCEIAGKGVTKASALERYAAEEAADYICRANNTGGVVEAIETFCLGA